MFPKYMQGGNSSLLQGGSGISLVQNTSSPQKTLKVGKAQPTVNPQAGQKLSIGSASPTLGVTTSAGGGVDSVAAAAAAQAAADAAKVADLRGEITSIANNIKDIFNSRYGQVDAAVTDQTNKLNDRFATESQDVTTQVGQENEKLGAAHAASGSYDSSYRGNNVDTVTKAGEAQIRDLGTELQDNLASIGGWGAQTKKGFDAEKSGINNILSRLAESTDVNELAQVRNTLESRITELQGGAADNYTTKQNLNALEQIAPSSVRAQQLKTTLSNIVAGTAEAGQKLAIAKRLVQSAQLTPEEQQALLNGVQSDLDKQQQQA